jgi:phage-related protein
VRSLACDAVSTSSGNRSPTDIRSTTDNGALAWISQNRDNLEVRRVPAVVKEDMGNALGISHSRQPRRRRSRWKGLRPGALEIVESHDGNAYRAVYMVRFENAVYVLHAFQKKSPSGIRTAKRDVDLVEHRLKHAQRDYEDHYGKTTR